MKRFYRDVTVSREADGWCVMLDGRGVRTAGGRPQVVPGEALARAMAAEWADQGEEIDPALFRFRDLADFAIDAVAPDLQGAIRDLLPYAQTDTLCYRGDEGEALHARQVAVWEPLLTRAERRWDVRFVRVSGIVHQPQPGETLARMTAALGAHDAFTLAALRMLASLAASLVIALAAIAPDADAEALWAAANLEEDWQAELWGRDAEAEARRQTRFAAFALAIRFAALCRNA
ncbi:ATP12 family chaperone protein [Novosphingobium album (ex Liu et al. 2023)]|uniref:Molecular chaperone n=1 Tax=Novosphingobium album (ex Liu et al. 2023) TaxID=3031130 RepID=A0ABT5WT73_9SPHN|nr:ATP12 family protein [Novosphingobium album (ex Liu et al. 2023)]MDE8652632.1 molecular chaperone [Novosphingobium album (ex Liu et al. 2023)]